MSSRLVYAAAAMASTTFVLGAVWGRDVNMHISYLLGSSKRLEDRIKLLEGDMGAYFKVRDEILADAENLNKSVAALQNAGRKK